MLQSTTMADIPLRHTTKPIVTGTSVLGLKYKDGVMLAADTLASYGSLAMFKDIRRINKSGSWTLVGGSGEMSDYQAIMHMLQELERQNLNANDGFEHSPAEIYHYLRAVMYNRRNKLNP